MKPLEFTHANLNTPVYIPHASAIFYYYYSKAEAVTRIVSTAGAFIPVKESPEQVELKIKETKT